MAGLTGELLTEPDLSDHTLLSELYLVCLARRRRERRSQVLVKIAKRRGDRPVDLRLLRLIWPSGAWTRTEALEILDKLGPDQRYEEGAYSWFYQATELDLKSADDLELHVALCGRLLSSPVYLSFSSAQIDQLQATMDIDRATREATRLSQLTPLIQAHPAETSRVVAQLLRSRVPAALAKIKGSSTEDLCDALLVLDPSAFARYLDSVGRMLSLWTEGAEVHLAALCLLGYAVTKNKGDEVDRLLVWAARHWERKDLARVIGLLAEIDSSAAEDFRVFVTTTKEGLSRRAVRSAVGKVTSFARDRRAASGREAGSTEPDNPVKGQGE
jgi:hypothetical protein